MRLRTRGRRNSRRRVPQLNTTATADISFMLLIFFLVTTSMDPDKGLRRQLPPRDNMTEVKAVDVDKDKVLTIDLTASGKVSINDTICTDNQLCSRVCEFVKRVGDEHIIELKADKTANYDSYFHLQNLLVHTYKNMLHGKYRQRISEEFVSADQPTAETISTPSNQ